ncbi:unnamed protein product, partial [Vitis vinifera]|uniref:Uncharacterized protein n=1 Tax=Vitis vinifera TaxID=29760 RepID=D7SKB0_VITVI
MEWDKQRSTMINLQVFEGGEEDSQRFRKLQKKPVNLLCHTTVYETKIFTVISCSTAYTVIGRRYTGKMVPAMQPPPDVATRLREVVQLSSHCSAVELLHPCPWWVVGVVSESAAIGMESRCGKKQQMAGRGWRRRRYQAEATWERASVAWWGICLSWTCCVILTSCEVCRYETPLLKKSTRPPEILSPLSPNIGMGVCIEILMRLCLEDGGCGN